MPLLPQEVSISASADHVTISNSGRLIAHSKFFTVANVSVSAIISIVDLTTTTQVAEFCAVPSEKASVNHMAFSPDDLLLAAAVSNSAMSTSNVRVFSVATSRRLLVDIIAHDDDNNGPTSATTSIPRRSNNNFSVVAFCPQQLPPLAEQQEQQEHQLCGGSAFIAAGTSTGELLAWNIADSTPSCRPFHRSSPGDGNRIDQIVFHPNKEHCIFAVGGHSAEQIHLYAYASNKTSGGVKINLLSAFPKDQYVPQQCSFHPTQDNIFFYHTTGRHTWKPEVAVVDLSQGRQCGSLSLTKWKNLESVTSTARLVAVSPSNELVLHHPMKPQTRGVSVISLEGCWPGGGSSNTTTTWRGTVSPAAGCHVETIQFDDPEVIVSVHVLDGGHRLLLVVRTPTRSVVRFFDL